MLALVLGIAFLVVGLNLLELSPSLAKIGFRLPSSIHHIADRIKRSNNPATPFLIGAITFVLPCGFTQTAQGLAICLWFCKTRTFASNDVRTWDVAGSSWCNLVRICRNNETALFPTCGRIGTFLFRTPDRSTAVSRFSDFPSLRRRPWHPFFLVPRLMPKLRQQTVQSR